MNKTDLIAKIADSAEITKKDAEAALNATVEAIKETLRKDGKVVLTGFGTFEVRTRKARTGHNPRTGAAIQIPAQKSPAFKAGKALKDAVKR